MQKNTIVNKITLISGGSSGIGFACAEIFGTAGGKIIITGRDSIKLNHASAQLRKKGIDCTAIVSDVSNEEDCKNLTNQVINKFGGLDLLINNAGMSMRGMVEDTDFNVIKKIMDINFYGSVYLTKLFLPHLIQSKGTIIAISSVAGLKGTPARSGYCASKFAMRGFFESLRIELMNRGVNVMIVFPGYTTSNIRNVAMNEKGEPQKENPLDESTLMSAEVVAKKILKGYLKKKREIVLTTQGKLIKWLNIYFPLLTDRLVYNHFLKEKDSPLKI